MRNPKKYFALIIAVLFLLTACFIFCFTSCKNQENTSDDSELTTDTEIDGTSDDSEAETDTESDDTTDDSEQTADTESDDTSDESEDETDTESDDTSDESEDTADTESDSVDDSEEAVDMYIAEKGVVNFRITTPSNLSASVSSSVENLYEALKKRSGGLPDFGNTEDVEYDAEAFEILIGDTGFAETVTAMSKIKYGESIACFCGNKLVIFGFSDDAVNKAITAVIKQIKAVATDDGTIIFKSDFEAITVVSELQNQLPTFENGRIPRIGDEGNDTSIVVMQGADMSEYSAYLTQLEAAGFVKYTTNEITDNKFATYMNDRYLVHTAYYGFNNDIRVSVEKKTGLAGLESENVWTKNDSVVTSLAHIGLDEDPGLSAAYQLADGSFIVIDGGFERSADRLYDYLKAQAPNGEIVIAAWILTHNDGDHARAFVKYVGTYMDDTKIEKIIMNIPPIYDGSVATVAAAKSLKNTELIKAHTGYKLYVRNAVIEILFTIDNLLPAASISENSASLLFTVDVEGERAMWTGDLTEEGFILVNSMYGSYLRSDILQLTHHGLRNGTGLSMNNTRAFYVNVCAEIVLWPHQYSFYYQYKGTNDQTWGIADFYWNKAATDNAREVYLGGDVVTVLELPYRAFSAYSFIEGEEREPVRLDKPNNANGWLSYKQNCTEENFDSIDW